MQNIVQTLSARVHQTWRQNPICSLVLALTLRQLSCWATAGFQLLTSWLLSELRSKAYGGKCSAIGGWDFATTPHAPMGVERIFEEFKSLLDWLMLLDFGE